MSERLTDEQLHETAENARGDVARTMAAELIVLRAYELNRDKEVTALRTRIAKLEAALEDIALEKWSVPEWVRDRARAALAETVEA